MNFREAFNLVKNYVEPGPLGLGYIYVLEPLDYHVKIGFSIQPKARLRKLQLSSGLAPRRAWVSPPQKCYREIEKLLHQLFFDYRKIGEYFNVSFDLVVDAAERLCEAPNLRKEYSLLVIEHNGRQKDVDM